MNINKGQGRINETQIMNNGQKATIIAYRGFNDIDVRFEDGTIVSNKTYQSFKRGNIRNFNNHIGEIRTMHNGMKAQIVTYRNANDIDVEFNDGTIVTHRAYRHFKNGCIRNPNIQRKYSKKEK